VPDADQDPAEGELQRAARDQGYWPFRGCFEEGLRRAPDLGGAVTVHLRFSPGGANSADVAASTVHDPVVVACLAREAGHMRLPANDLSRAAVLQITLGAGDEPVFIPPPIRNAQAWRQALRGSWSAVEQCFADVLAKTPDAGGRMELRFRVKPDGVIAEVAEADTRFRAIDVTRCVLGVYRAANLPGVAVSGGDATFVYPLHFEAAPAGAF
jgi:hypothetical protein